MKYLIAFITVLWLAEPALAACTTHTIMTPDGRIMTCMTCCTASYCTTTCN